MAGDSCQGDKLLTDRPTAAPKNRDKREEKRGLGKTTTTYRVDCIGYNKRARLGL